MKIKLREMREKRGLNQRELSERSLVPQPMISEIETGAVTNPQINTLYKLSVALRCAVDDLIDPMGKQHETHYDNLPHEQAGGNHHKLHHRAGE